MLVLYDPVMLEHEPGPDHPESPARFWSLQRLLEAGRLPWSLPTHRVGAAELSRVHDPAYVRRVLSGEAWAIDEETVLAPGSLAAVLAAASVAWSLGDALRRNPGQVGFALLRPPGHHAGRAQGSGYCFFNHVILAARAAEAPGLDRVVIVDLDAHYPQGTAELVAGDPRVTLLTLQQSRLFPCDPPNGELDDPSVPPNVVSVPLDPGAGDADLQHVIDRLFVPLLLQLRPAIVLVSLGIDGHADDAMSELTYSTGGFARTARVLGETARELGASLGYVLEGGYDPASLAASILAMVEQHMSIAHVSRPSDRASVEPAGETAPAPLRSTGERVASLRGRHLEIASP